MTVNIHFAVSRTLMLDLCWLDGCAVESLTCMHKLIKDRDISHTQRVWEWFVDDAHRVRLIWNWHQCIVFFIPYYSTWHSSFNNISPVCNFDWPSYTLIWRWRTPDGGSFFMFYFCYFVAIKWFSVFFFSPCSFFPTSFSSFAYAFAFKPELKQKSNKELALSEVNWQLTLTQVQSLFVW